jgi:hypothetical protein
VRYAAPKVKAASEKIRVQKKSAAAANSQTPSTEVEREAEEASECAGPGVCDCPSCRLSVAAGPGPYRAADDTAPPQPYGVIVDDDRDLAEGQIHKTDFIDQAARDGISR